jgi:hypothetical protein
MNDHQYELIGESIWNTYKKLAYILRESDAEDALANPGIQNRSRAHAPTKEAFNETRRRVENYYRKVSKNPGEHSPKDVRDAKEFFNRKSNKNIK